MLKKLNDFSSLLRKELADRQLQQKKYDWQAMARPSQRIPQGPWRIWLILAGRGFGKTRTGAETVRHWILKEGYRRVCLMGHHLDDVRRVMIEGESGLLGISRPDEKIKFEPSKRQLSWPNGALALAYSGDTYQQLRGPQFDAAWVDELAKFSYAQEAWDQLMLCLRLGSVPRIIVTTTPRPCNLLKNLLQRSDIVVTRGNTFENKDHLPASYLEDIKKTYHGTRLGAQEIEGVLMESFQEGLWKQDMIRYCSDLPPMERIVVAIDPAVTNKESSDETGIIVAGRDYEGNGYIIDDLSGRFSPTEWIKCAADAYYRFSADRLIAEINNGGDIVEQLLHTLFPSIPYKGVHAKRSKVVRAEPISALYEQGKIFHQKYFPLLESQLLTHSSGSQFDRLDALVWALTELFLTSATPRILSL